MGTDAPQAGLSTLSRLNGIPEELLQFVRAPGGHSLIVKGGAGTGKTTFALQLAEELGEGARSYYMSIRVSDHTLYRQFPWLLEKKAGAAVQRVISPEVGVGAKEEKPAKGPMKVDRTELQKLEGRVEMGQEGDEVYQKVGEGEAAGDSIIFDLGSDLPEIDLAYDEVERNLPNGTLVLVDSIDGLSERYGIMAGKLINTLQKDLVEKGNANVVYVLESTGDTRLDYLGDGVVKFQSEEHAGRRLREMTIEKLRGTEIRQHRYLYTLKDGRIRAFSNRPPSLPANPGPWAAVPDLGRDIVSWGHSALDQITGGLRAGALVALEVDPEVPSVYVDGLKLGLLCNFAARAAGSRTSPRRSPPRRGSRSGPAPT